MPAWLLIDTGEFSRVPESAEIPSLTMPALICMSMVHLRRHIRKAENGVCPGGATQNLPPLYRGVCIVAQEVERHLDTPKFCVRVIFDIYPMVYLG